MVKYIVYLTVNKVNFKSYIGVHKSTRPTFDGYIGCGIKYKNDTILSKPKTPFQFAVKKYGYDNFHRITLGEFDNEKDAYALEVSLVTKAWIESDATYNVALGGKAGENASNKPVLKYDSEGNFVKEYKSVTEASSDTPRTCNSEINKSTKSLARKSGGFHWRYKLSNTIEPKIDVEEISNKKRKILQLDEIGNVVAEFESVRAAHRAGFKGISNSLKGRTKLSSGFMWKYKED